MATLFEETSALKREMEDASSGSCTLDAYNLPEVRLPGERYTARQVALALDAAGGYVTYAARILKCRVETVRKYIKNYPVLAEILSDVNDFHLDTSEVALLRKRDAGDNTAIIFHLKCKGKKRGYIDNAAINFNAEVDLERANWKDVVDEATRVLSGDEVCRANGDTAGDTAPQEGTD